MNESGSRLQFGMRTMLVALTIVGGSVGLLARLFFRNPQLSIAILGYASVVIPFLAATGTLVYLGIKSKKTPLAYWGVFLLLVPVVGTGTISLLHLFISPGGGALGFLSNQQLINQELPKGLNSPQVWRELERRIKNGKLPVQDVNKAVDQLAAAIGVNSPYPYNQPLHWQDDFLREARKNDLISQANLINLCDAFYGTSPKITSVPRNQTAPVNLRMEFGGHFTDEIHHGLGVTRLWKVKRVLADGNPVKLDRNLYHFSRSWQGSLATPIVQTIKELSIEFEVAYIDTDKLIGLNTNQLTPDLWPKAIKRWTVTAVVPEKGKPQSSQVKTTIAGNRMPNLPTVERLVVQRGPAGFKTVVLQFANPQAPKTSISCDVLLESGDITLGIGQLVIHSAPGDGVYSTNNPLVSEGHQIPESLESATILLEPNATHLKTMLDQRDGKAQVVEMWGGQLKIGPVKVERLDLESR